MTKIIALAAFAGAMTFAQTQASAFEDKDVIDYRERIMKTLQEQTAILGMIASYAIPGDNLAAHAEAIALSAKLAAKSFDAKVEGGEAKPEVWTKNADFKAKMAKFVEKSQAMSDAAKKGAGISEITEMLVDALPCKDCHDMYRDEKK